MLPPPTAPTSSSSSPPGSPKLLGGSDASVIALAERLEIDRVATLDRRHFTVVWPRHRTALTLLP